MRLPVKLSADDISIHADLGCKNTLELVILSNTRGLGSAKFLLFLGLYALPT